MTAWRGSVAVVFIIWITAFYRLPVRLSSNPESVEKIIATEFQEKLTCHVSVFK